MRSSVWTAVLCAAIAGSLVSCSERPPASGGQADKELTALVERARGMQAKLTADSGARAELKPEFERLVGEVKAWQSRTGRSDIRTGIDSARSPVTGAAARDDGGGGEVECASCPGYSLEGDKICFLIEEGECMDLDTHVGRVCAYECIWSGARTEPGQEAEAGKK